MFAVSNALKFNLIDDFNKTFNRSAVDGIQCLCCY